MDFQLAQSAVEHMNLLFESTAGETQNYFEFMEKQSNLTARFKWKQNSFNRIELILSRRKRMSAIAAVAGWEISACGM